MLTDIKKEYEALNEENSCNKAIRKKRVTNRYKGNVYFVEQSAFIRVSEKDKNQLIFLARTMKKKIAVSLKGTEYLVEFKYITSAKERDFLIHFVNNKYRIVL